LNTRERFGAVIVGTETAAALLPFTAQVGKIPAMTVKEQPGICFGGRRTKRQEHRQNCDSSKPHDNSPIGKHLHNIFGATHLILFFGITAIVPRVFSVQFSGFSSGQLKTEH
jgi:hypothetical protein